MIRITPRNGNDFRPDVSETRTSHDGEAKAWLKDYCYEEVPFGKAEAINGNIPGMLRRCRGCRDHEYLLLKVRKASAPRRLRQTA
jgi:hypothetical protein